jgi:hypothetical protein
MRQNPFERFGIDPRLGPSGITERLRELIEEAHSDKERSELRAVWEKLTMHPENRLLAALQSTPETRPPLASRPAVAVPVAPLTLTLADLAMLPRVSDALSDSRKAPGEVAVSNALANDPLLRRQEP